MIKGEDFRGELYREYVSTYKNTYSNDLAADLKSYSEIFKRKFIPLIKDFKKDAAILEIGCGPGNVLQFLKNAGFENLYGIDISEEQVKEASTKGLNVEAADVFEFFKRNNKTYDIVFVLDFIEHFHKNELLDLFKGFNKILNENGIIIFRTPNGQGIFPNKNIYGDLTHLTIFNTYSLLQILQITGFSDIKFLETSPVPKNFYGIIRSILWKVVRLGVIFIRMIEVGKGERILTQDLICTAGKKST